MIIFHGRRHAPLSMSAVLPHDSHTYTISRISSLVPGSGLGPTETFPASASEEDDHTYHVDQNIQRTLPSLDRLGSVVLLPAPPFVLPKVSAKRLLTPRRIDRVGDRREGGYGFVPAWVLQEL